MKPSFKLYACAAIALGLTACQSSKPYNGVAGYQVENQTSDTATLSYTLAGRQDRAKDEQKLQQACQKVLGANKTYRLAILSSNEIVNQNTQADEQYGRQIGNSRTSFGLSNTPDLHNNDNLATREALNARPSTLRVIRYTCA